MTAHSSIYFLWWYCLGIFGRHAQPVQGKLRLTYRIESIPLICVACATGPVMVKFRRFTKTVNKMAICGTCNSEVPRNMRKKIDRTVSGVSLRRLLSEYFDFSPLNPTVCRQCNVTLEQIVRINVKLEKLTIQRNSIITDFNAKLSESKNIPESAEIPVPQSDENQVKCSGITLNILVLQVGTAIFFRYIKWPSSSKIMPLLLLVLGIA